ncbi:lamin tail domain-containing protein 2 isoform X4 [Homo sapiens]|uniref:lamin tail domain-containing protein 2 isoform X4 n=1 Tax=Homo sapiens TaxID=9606 RepID=UPI0007DC72A6|nr:lamin tail domain-containing protein 2 isoform X4 [Homo sapiens]|eukprot:XP_011518269.2 lamin tail domain-containing protein 2 isoform X4 [Homo sapiens]
MLGPPSGCWSLSGPPAKLSSGSASHTSSRLGWPRTHLGAWSGVSLEAPGNKQPHPFWVLVSMATVYSPSLPGLLGGRASEQESVSGHLGPPAGAPAAPETPTCLPDTTPHPAPVVCSADPQLALESLDPRTLRLLWRQRELEIQALRWAIQNGEDARLCHILEEVAGLPPKRSSHSQEKLLQNQVQKLIQELKEQKERAQWALSEQEKEHLEERLLQTTRTLQEMEAELQNLQKSCLLQLARSSWVGRMLRSQTGSVEVVTAETLMDPSDLSENIQAPTGEGFRLEDVDWNSVARRYPNLFTNMEPSSKQKQPRPWPQLDTGSPESSGKHSERHHKTVEWGSLPCLNTSSSGGADSDSSSCRPGLPSFVQVIGHPPRDHRASSEQALVQAGSYSRDSEDLQKTHSPRHGEPVLSPQPCTDPDHWSPELLQSPTGLKIVAVSCREKFVRIFNPSQESTADLSGMVLKQLVRGFPERLYRFPPGTLLAPRHHVTVLSEHRIPRRETPAPRVFADGTDLSIDRFPLPEAGPGADTRKPPRPPRPLRKGRVREPRVSRRRPGTRGLLPPVSSGKLFHAREGPARPENPEIPAPQHLPAIPGDPTLPSPPAEAGLGLEDCRLQKEHRVRVCRKSVDRSCPLVALSVQNTAESRFGFRFLSCLPVTADTCRGA